jgi:hypothetical protein
MSIPYSNKIRFPTMEELQNFSHPPSVATNNVVVLKTKQPPTYTLVDVNTLVTGGGGGGATITGTDDAVVFKNGSNGDAPNTGITKNTSLTNYAASLDTSGKKLAVNHPGGSISDALEVNGSGRFVGSSGDEMQIRDENIGLVAGTNKLKLYNRNLTAPVSGLTQIDSLVKNVESSSFRSYEPDTDDAPNTTDTASVYKIRLRRGMDLWSGTPPFSRQNTFDPTQTEFPTGQTVEYQNKLPIQYPAILSRTASGVAVAPATTYVISLFGTYSSFQDRMIYDPTGMRAFINPTNGWTTAAAPTNFRTEDTKCLMRVKWNFKGRWSGSDPTNRAEIYVNQYRSGALLRNFQVAISNNDDTCVINGERTFIGFNSVFGEDFDCSQDWYEIEVANMSGAGNSVTADYAHTEVQFILAQ